MRRLSILIAGLVLIGLLSVAAPPVARATGGTFVIDFDANNTGYEPVYGTIGAGRTGSGWYGQAVYVGNDPYHWHTISRVSIPMANLCAGADVTLTEVSMYGFATSANNNAGTYLELLYKDGHSSLLRTNIWQNSTWKFIKWNNTWRDLDSINVRVDNSTPQAGQASVQRSIMDDISISYSCAISAAFTVDVDSGTAPLRVQFTDQSIGATSWAWDLGDGNSTTSQNITYTYTNPGAYTVRLTASDGISSDDATHVIYVTSETSFSGAATYKPLVTGDQDPEWGMYDRQLAVDLLEDPIEGVGWPSDNVVTAWSNSPGAYVHAVGSGDVTDVDTVPVAAGCLTGINGIGLVGGQCLLVVPRSITGGDNEVFRIDQTTLYRVTVQYGVEQEITYLVDSPTVTQGAHVEAGCIIGETFQVYPLIGADLNQIAIGLGFDGPDATGYFGAATALDKGVTLLLPYLTDDENPTPQRLLPLLLLEPDSLTPCNVDPAHASCQRGANMYDPADWDKSGSVIWNIGTAPTLYSGALIMQQWPFDQSQALSFVVNVRRLGNSGHVQLQLGNRIQDFELTASVSTVSLPAVITTADHNPLYTVSIVNTGLEPIQITNGCVSVGTPTQSANTCLFANPSFDDGLSSWSHSGDIQIGNYIGEVFVHDGSTLTQAITLYPDASAPYEYQVTLRAAPGGVGWQDQLDSTVGFSWEYGALSGDFISPSSSTSFSLSAFNATPNYINFFPGGEVVFQASVVVSAVQNDPFIITVNYTQDEGWEGPILIRELCVTDAIGDYIRGGGGGGNPYQPTCAVVSPPQDENLSSWTFFLWSALDRFFRCELMIAVNKGLDGLNQLATFLRWQMLYWQAFATSVVNWVPSQVIPWLGGHFYNIAAGRVTTINSVETPGTSVWDVLYALLGGNGSSNLWDVLSGLINSVLGPFTATILALFTQAANLLFFLVTSLLSIILSITTQLFTFVGTLFSWIGGLVDAWNNAVPTVPDGVPNCTTYTDSAFCIAIWTLDNILAIGPGPILVAVIIGMGSLNVLVWVIEQIRNIVQTVAEAT